MKFKVVFFGLVLTTAALSAHKYDHLKIEQLKLLVQEQEQMLEHKNKVIENQTGLILFLEGKLAHYKHELHKEKAYNTFKEILKSLGF